MEWVNPLFCSGYSGPELVEIARGNDPLGRKHQPATQIEWQKVLDAALEIIVVAVCGYDVDRVRHDCERPRKFPGFDTLPAAQRAEIRLRPQKLRAILGSQLLGFPD